MHSGRRSAGPAEHGGGDGADYCSGRKHGRGAHLDDVHQLPAPDRDQRELRDWRPRVAHLRRPLLHRVSDPTISHTLQQTAAVLTATSPRTVL